MFTAGRIVRVQLIVMFVLAIPLVTSWFVTNPDLLGPFGITVWFLGLFLTLANLFSLILYTFKRRRGQPERALAVSIRQGILLSIWISSLLALNSLKQLSVRDVVLISLLVVLGEFYMRRSR